MNAATADTKTFKACGLEVHPAIDRHSALKHMQAMVAEDSPNCTLVKREVVDLLALLKEQDPNPEAHRREAPSLSTNPIPDLVGMLDYATAGTKIDKAKAHLDEGLPGGQKLRCETAFNLMRAGVEELGVWMRARGYEV